jgi:hypothetical protein
VFILFVLFVLVVVDLDLKVDHMVMAVEAVLYVMPMDLMLRQAVHIQLL